MFGGVESNNIREQLSNIQQIISADQTLNRINNSLKGEIVDLQNNIISKGRPLVNDEGHAAIMNATGLIVNESIKLGMLDDHDIEVDSSGFGEAITFLVGVHGSELGIEPKDMFGLVTGLETLGHSVLTSARSGTTLKNLTQQIQMIDQRVSSVDEKKSNSF